MPSATDFLDAPQALPSASAFLGAEDIPVYQPQVSSPEAPDTGLRGRISDFLFSPEGAQTTREAIQGAVESVPQMAMDTAKMGYKGLRLATGDPEERARIMEEALAQAKGQGEQTAEDIQSPFGTPEFLRGAGQLTMMATPGLELARELRAPVEIPVEIPREVPPVEAPPEATAPPPPPVQIPPPPIGTPLKPVPLIGPPGTTAADAAAAQGTVRLYHGGAGEQAGSDFTTDLGYAQGYANKTPGGRVWQVDVPQGLLKTHDEYGQPMTRVVVPNEIANQARPLTPEPYTPEAAAARSQQPPSVEPQAAPIGASNEIARAREQAGLTEAPPSGIGIGWHDSVNEGNTLIDKGADAYKVLSDFKTNKLINRQRMGVARAWLERLQRANTEARGALEQNPANPDLALKAQDAEAAENAFWQGYQPMKTEWSNIGTGMQEMRGITDTDLLSQKTAEQAMREQIDRELTPEDKVRAAKAVNDTRAANAKVDATFDNAITQARRSAKGPPRSLEQLRNDLAAKLKELTPC